LDDDCGANCGIMHCTGAGECSCECGFFKCKCTQNKPNIEASIGMHMSEKEYIKAIDFATFCMNMVMRLARMYLIICEIVDDIQKIIEPKLVS